MTVDIYLICKKSSMKISGKLIDIHNREIYPAVVSVHDSKIESIEKVSEADDGYLLPGLIDAHIHIESSMVTPGSFAVAAVSRGTCAVVSDPQIGRASCRERV